MVKTIPAAGVRAIVRLAVALILAAPWAAWPASGVLYAGTAPYAGYPTIQAWCDGGFRQSSAGSVCKGPATCTLLPDNMYRFTCPDADESPEPSPDVAQAGMCHGNPIMASTGEKLLHEVDYQGSGAHPLSVTRSFRSSRIVGQTTGAAAAGLGQVWSHNHHVQLKTTCVAQPPMDLLTEYRYVFGQYVSPWSSVRGGPARRHPATTIRVLSPVAATGQGPAS